MKKIIISLCLLFFVVGCGTVSVQSLNKNKDNAIQKENNKVDKTHEDLVTNLIYNKKYIADPNSKKNQYYYDDAIYLIFEKNGIVKYSENMCEGFTLLEGTYKSYIENNKEYVKVTIEDAFVTSWTMEVGKDTLTVLDVKDEDWACGFVFDYMLKK